MLCPRCHRENRDSSEFCAACGAPLSLRDEPAPRSLDVTVPLDRRGRERASPPPPPRPRAAPPTTEWLAPPASDENARSHWDLGAAAGAARPEPAPAPPAPPPGSATWDGRAPAAPRATPTPTPIAAPLPRAVTATWAGVGALAASTPAPAPAAQDRTEPDASPLTAELDLAEDVDLPAANEVRLRRAPAWRRVLSWAIDAAPFGALTGWLANETLDARGRAALGSVDGAIDLLAREAGVVLPFVAFLALAGATYLALAYALMGASVGKWATGLRVVSHG